MPTNFGLSQSLTVVKLCSNLIAEVPESTARMPKLRSLWLDHNPPLSALPWNFYMLTSLVDLHMDGNARPRRPAPAGAIVLSQAGMMYPTQAKLVEGAEAVRTWFKRRQKHALFVRRHRIAAAGARMPAVEDPPKTRRTLQVTTMQDIMEQLR